MLPEMQVERLHPNSVSVRLRLRVLARGRRGHPAGHPSHRLPAHRGLNLALQLCPRPLLHAADGRAAAPRRHVAVRRRQRRWRRLRRGVRARDGGQNGRGDRSLLQE